MKNLNSIFLADFTGGAVVWTISIVLAFAIIIVLILIAKKKRKINREWFTINQRRTITLKIYDKKVCLI